MNPDPQSFQCTIEFLPLETATENLDALGIAEGVRTEMYQELHEQPDATVRVLPASTRSGGMIEFLQQMVQTAADHQTILAIYTYTLVTLVTRLLKHRRIGKVELQDVERTLIIEDTDLEKVQPLISDFLASQPPPQADTEEHPSPSLLARTMHIIARTVQRR
jgi:hypothetical protein